MTPLIARIRRHLRYRFLLAPRGMGRPASKEVFDREYRSGKWDHFFSAEELPRNMVVLGAATAHGPAPSVLDLGCGSGRLAALLAPHQPRRYVGVDLSTVAITRARNLGLPGFEFVEASFETWRPDGQFDVVIFNECLGYAIDPGATLARFCACVGPDGRVIISLYRSGNYRAIWRRLSRHGSLTQKISLANDRGQAWDIRVLSPRPTTKSSSA